MKRHGFTLVEMLTVLAIITILVGLLVPSMTMVRRVATEAKQKAMLTSIGAALATFRNDYGDYPPSDDRADRASYGGAQKLAEAMFGQDLHGFHPQTDWLPGSGIYGFPRPRPSEANLRERKSPYLDLSTVQVVMVSDYYSRLIQCGTNPPLHLAAYFIADVFGREKLTLPSGQIVKVGPPILYYKANPNSRIYDGEADVQSRIYNCTDNGNLIAATEQLHNIITRPPPCHFPAPSEYVNFALRHPDFFYGSPPTIPFGYIQDPRVLNPWPWRVDSYLLITAGADGIYGTEDDIKNFGF